MTVNQTLETISMTHHLPANELSTLLKVSSALASSLDLPVVLQTAIESTAEVLGLDTGAVYMLEGDLLYLGATTPRLTPEEQWMLLQPEPLDNHPHLKEALTRGQPVSLTDARSAELTPAEAAICEARHLKSSLYIPLLLEGKATGALIVSSQQRLREFSAAEIDLCRTLSYQITLAVANARLYRTIRQAHDELIRTYDATLQGWSLALEMRDQETQGHTLRVVQMSVNLAHKMGVPEADILHIKRGALLHDIGKISVPDRILKKPGPLSAEEWAIMRKHPEHAYQFLAQIDYLLPAVEIPYCHHEKWDGSGYPRGLRGVEIPLAARIFAVADVYDALTSERPYRPAWPAEAAVQYIREQAGRHFDPRVVEMFLSELE